MALCLEALSPLSLSFSISISLFDIIWLCALWLSIRLHPLWYSIFINDNNGQTEIIAFICLHRHHALFPTILLLCRLSLLFFRALFFLLLIRRRENSMENHEAFDVWCCYYVLLFLRTISKRSFFFFCCPHFSGWFSVVSSFEQWGSRLQA